MALDLDLTAAGGYIYYYGITPWINCLEDNEICKLSVYLNNFLVLRDKEEINIFLGGTSDPRHILKTLMYLNENQEELGNK